MSIAYPSRTALARPALQETLYSPFAAVKSWLARGVRRRMQRRAAAQLRAMGDRELRDIGLSRPQIEFAVAGLGGGDSRQPLGG